MILTPLVPATFFKQELVCTAGIIILQVRDDANYLYYCNVSMIASLLIVRNYYVHLVPHSLTCICMHITMLTYICLLHA